MEETYSTEEGFFPGTDGLPVYYKKWVPATPVARIIAFHGLGEHIKRYDHLFTYFAQQGFLVRGFDIRGHGETIKKRLGDTTKRSKEDLLGHALMEDLWEDAMILESWEKSGNEKGLPLFYFGHSLGGLMAQGS
jgi:acylglycerol lipase